MLKHTEGSIRNVQFREIDNLGYIRRTKTQHNMCGTPLRARHKTRTIKTETQHNMCWTPLYTRHKTRTIKTKTQHNMCGTPLHAKQTQIT